MTPLLSIEDALNRVLYCTQRLPIERAPLGPTALGQVLAADVASDLDSPPFDKALVDGYAVRAADLAAPGTALRIVEEIRAGHPPTRPIRTGEAAAIMTGAPLPVGADAVVMMEHTQRTDDRVMVVECPKPGQNILRQATEMRRGDVVLRAGQVIRAPELGLLASVGCGEVPVIRRPQVAVLATGDELVDVDCVPQPGQIRNSNLPMLLAQAAAAGAVARDLGTARDRADELRARMEDGLADPDVLVLSGGVSAGAADLVPAILTQVGVRTEFHKIAMKPGKPLFFGTLGPKLVFGLPGNPVSSFVGFEIFVRPALQKLAGYPAPWTRRLQAALTAPLQTRNNRPTFHPALLTVDAAGVGVRAVPWFGSPDLRALSGANALLILPAGEVDWPVGQAADVVPTSEVLP
jgi:molybdopterin molybdotransferase